MPTDEMPTGETPTGETPTYEPFSALLTGVTLGMDALERRRTRGAGLLDDEGLLPIYLGGDLIPPRQYADWTDVDADLERLTQQLPTVTPASRRVFAAAMLRSLQAAARLFSGVPLDYAGKVRDLVGAPEGAVPEEEIAAIRDALDASLRRAERGRHGGGRADGKGTLAERIVAWEASRALPANALEPTFEALLAAGRERTAARIFDVGDFSMTLHPVRGVPYTARCGFDQRRMDLNVDLEFTRAALKHLVAHEVFPGHATQLLLTRARVAAGAAQPETLLCTANTVLGCVQEGIADEGVGLIDWFEDDDDHIYLEVRRLRSAVQTSAAWYLMAEGRPVAEVAEYLRAAGAGQEAWVQGRLNMAAHPFRGPFIASYWAGARAVRRVAERVVPADFPRFVDYLYGQAHSPASLAMFA